MQPTLLVLAAGMGSRYGGLKQLDPMGPDGETLLDYSVADAARAGFGKAVFVIREDFADAFKATVARRHEGTLAIDYAYQRIDDLPDGFTPSPERTKPWGTAHAVRAAREIVREPFVVINADDFYDADAYARAAAFLRRDTVDEAADMAMVAYPVRRTLSPNGPVNRGICRCDGDRLVAVEEHTEIREQPDGTISGFNAAGEPVKIAEDSPASMNFWLFRPTIFDTLEAHFVRFLRDNGDKPKAECYIPSVVDAEIREGGATCGVLTTGGSWFGVTYPEDKPGVREQLRHLRG